MNSKSMITAMAVAMGMATPFSGDYYMPDIPKQKPLSRKDEQKKCKSCKYFHKNAAGTISCGCYYKHIRPTSVACANYEKRRK